MLKLLLLLLTALFSINIYAEEIKVVTEENPPFNYKDSTGKFIGMGTEIVEAVLKKSGVSYKMEVLPWKRAYELVQADKNTLIFSMGRNEKRENLFKWIGVVAPTKYYFWTLTTLGKEIKKYDDAKGLSIGAVSEALADQHLKAKGFKPKDEIEYANDYETNLKKLNEGRIKVLPLSEPVIKYLAKKINMDQTKLQRQMFMEEISSGLWMAFNKDSDPATVKKVQDAYDAFKATPEYQKIVSKYEQ